MKEACTKLIVTRKVFTMLNLIVSRENFNNFPRISQKNITKNTIKTKENTERIILKAYIDENPKEFLKHSAKDSPLSTLMKIT